jgi:tripartite ATP-independent transporter DctM subunit
MDPFWLGILGIVITMILIIFRFPIAFVLAGVGMIGMMLTSGIETSMMFIPRQLYSYISHFTFTAVPLFLLMGYFAFYAGLTVEAYDAARAWAGRLPGGLALTTVGGCALFAASAGSSLAECAAMAKIAVPEMRRSGYSDRLATGVVASAGGMAVVIPPSIIMIIYGVITETSIGELLIAGILPGILYFGVFAVAIVIFAYLRPASAPRETNVDTSWKARRASIKKIWGIMALFGLVIGGIYGGLVTPTEAAALGAMGAIILALFRKKVNWENSKTALSETVKATAMIFLLLGGASIFTLFLSSSGVIASTTSALVGLDISPHMLLLALFVLYIILGMFLDSISMMILTMPLIVPILNAQNLSIVWFGVIMCMIVEIGCITPPMGLNVYVMKGALGKSVDLNDIFAGALPFVVLEIFIVLILYWFPQIALWLPGKMIQ